MNKAQVSVGSAGHATSTGRFPARAPRLHPPPTHPSHAEAPGMAARQQSHAGAGPSAAYLLPRTQPYSSTAVRADLHVVPRADYLERSPEQLYVPPSPASSSSSSDSLSNDGTTNGRSWGRSGGGGAAPRRHDAPPPPAPPSPSQVHAWHSRINDASNWYQLRAMLVTDGAGGTAADTAASPDAMVAVLKRFAAVTRYDMRPPEAAELAAFLERWLLRHTAALRHMSPCQLALTLHSLAKLPRALPAPPAPWVAAWFAAAQPYLLRAAFRPKDVSLSLWALSRLQLRLPPAALQLLLAAAEPHLPRFKAQDISLVALALAALQPMTTAAAAPPPPAMLPGPSWQRAFLQRCREVVHAPDCGSQALSNMLHGIVRSGMAAPDWLLGDLTAALYGRLDEAAPQALANVLSTLAARRYAPEAAWMDAFWQASAERMDCTGAGRGGGIGGPAGQGPSFNTDDLGYLAAAAAELELGPPQWWTTRLHRAMELQLGAAGPRQLTQLLYGMAKLYQFTAAAAAAAAGHGEVGEAGERTWDGGTPAPYVARPPRSLLTEWHRAAAAALPRFNALDAAQSLWALAALGERPPRPWLQALLVQCRPHLPGTPPAHLAVLLWSLAAVRAQPTWSWVADCLEAAAPGLPHMTGQDYAMMASALVDLGSRPSRAWSAALLEAMRLNMDTLSLRQLAQTAWALYRLRVQPPAAWLEALAADLQRRWAPMGAGSEGKGRGERGSRRTRGDRQLVRDTVLLLWVLSRWLGRQTWVPSWRRGACRDLVAGITDAASPPVGLDTRLQGSVEQGRARAFPVVLRSSAPAAGTLVLRRPPLFPATSAAAPPPSSPSPTSSPPSLSAPSGPARPRRVSARMRRRQRALRPGSLVVSHGGSMAAAAAFRRRVADALLGPAMDFLAPHLAVGAATPTDVALLADTARWLPLSVRAAAAQRPHWVPALLEVARPHLAALPPGTLLKLLAGAAAMRVPVDATWAAAAAASVRPHVTSLITVGEKVALLRWLCQLEVAAEAATPLSPLPVSREGRESGHGAASRVAAQHGRAVRAAATYAGHAVRPWGTVLEDALTSMRAARDAAVPLFRLRFELMKARVRLRKLAAAAAAADTPAAASAQRHRVTDAAAAVRRTAAAALQAHDGAAAAAYDTEALMAAAAGVRAAVSGAAAALSATRAGGSGRGLWPSNLPNLPRVTEEQRGWMRTKARRFVAAHLAESSPEAVARLVGLAARQQAPAPLPAVAPPPAGSGVPCPAATRSEETPRSELPISQQSLLWLASATSGCWRRMLPTHRVRAAQAWRRLLAAEATRRSGPGERDVCSQLQALLPQRMGSTVVACRARGRACAARRRHGCGVRVPSEQQLGRLGLPQAGGGSVCEGTPC